MTGRSTMRTRVVAFVKDPLSEPVKTRLGQSIGERRSLEFYEICLRLLKAQFEELSRFGIDTMIAVSSQQPSGILSEIFGGIERCNQGFGSIGERLNAVDVFVREHCLSSKVVFIGSDAPTLPSEIILSAVHALHDFDVAIAPATDGGFTVLASRRPLPVFGLGVRWSHAETFKDTVTLLLNEKFSYSKLKIWHDVDDLADILSVRNYLSSQKSLTELQAQLLAFTSQFFTRGQ